MRKTHIGIYVLLFLIFGCSVREEQGILRLVVKGKYADQPLIMGAEYPYFEGSKISFTKSEFFISEIAVKDQQGNWIELNPGNPKFVNLQNHHFNIENALAGLKISIGSLPPGDYTYIRMGIGLPASINNLQPKDFPSSSTLGQGDHYWAGWNSFIFSKTEGIIKNAPQMANFAYHSGFNEAYQMIEFNTDLKIIDETDSEIVMNMDHQRIFGNSTNFINIYQDPIIHEGGTFMDNFMNQLRSSIEILK
ncbi:MAG: hypothetical protein IPH93_08985 [Saprospiraceae bacterium]|nr:hypothetical protein [Saprospiraceae bacterium]MBK7810627.1 hypothetical protein [Saprospiraceae bacterium]MBK9630219.1 hypothetical protein [Saprospiraceae bacterium]